MRRLRDNRRPCTCPGYHFPHRRGSACCVANPLHHQHRWERNTGTSWKTGRSLTEEMAAE